MKNKTLFVSLFAGTMFFMSLSAEAQLRKLPSSVTDSFNLRFPGATKVEWKDKITVWQADFIFNSATDQAKFNSKGQWQSTEKTIKQDDLPAVVKDGLNKSKYAVDWKVAAVYERSVPGSIVQYHIEVYKSDIQRKNLLFSDSGRLLKDASTL